MNSTSKKFARAFVAQNSGHNFSELKELVEEIIFITSGYDDEGTLPTTVIDGLQDFSPRRDVIVPVGNVFINLLVGMVAAELSKDWGHFRVALYRDKEYHIQLVSVSNIRELLNAYKTSSTSNS